MPDRPHGQAAGTLTSVTVAVVPDMSSLRGRPAQLVHQLGLPGVVLVAAVLADLGVLGSAAIDSTGAALRDLLLLPGIVGLSACAVWGRSRPVLAAWAGACVLAASTALLTVTHAPTYSTLLPETTFAECVAGTLLVYYCARSARVAAAAVTTVALVVTELASIVFRGYIGDVERVTLLVGILLLAGAVGLGMRARQAGATLRGPELLRTQWLLVGLLALTLFLDASVIMRDAGPSLVLLLPAAGSAVVAVLAARHPVRAVAGLAGMFTLTTLLAVLTADGMRFESVGGLPITATLSGMIVVAQLVRTEPLRHRAGGIAVLAGVVAGNASIQVYGSPYSSSSVESMLSSLAIAAVLLLGLAIAIGMFLRARDSERTTTVEAAIAEAQAAERMALARELHDIVAHHVTGIVVQAQAVRVVAQQNPHVVADSLGQIENAGTEALVAMRRLVRSMRGDGVDAGENQGSNEQATTDLGADLHRLAGSGTHGVAVDVDVDLPTSPRQEVARSALRIVQEALTNVTKHAAGATRASVSVRTTGTDTTEAGTDAAAGNGTADGTVDGLRIRVADDGAPGEPGPVTVPGGYGLVGMHERVELLGGTLRTGRGDDGWVVEAWLPLRGDEESQ